MVYILYGKQSGCCCERKLELQAHIAAHIIYTSGFFVYYLYFHIFRGLTLHGLINSMILGLVLQGLLNSKIPDFKLSYAFISLLSYSF
ncbi:hypothetical protein F5X96DRAFT_637706, partial [Biscogniauxia mediterranea]